MTMLFIYGREHTLLHDLESTFGCRSNFLERLKCVRADQHLFEGADGSIIPPLACSFSTVKTNLLAVADEDGGIIILDTHTTGLNALKQDWHAHKNAIFDIEWVPGAYRLVTASGDQTAQLWDVSNEVSISTFKGHASSIKTVQHCDDPHIFATGARDGHVMVWDTRVKAKNGYIPAVNTIQNAHAIQSSDGGSATKRKRVSKNQQQHNSQQSVTALAFQDEHTLITSGSVDGSVKLWDLRKNYSILKSEPIAFHKFAYSGKSARSHGFSSLVLDSTKTRLFANCMDNTIYLYDCAGLSPKPVASYRGHTNSSFYVKMSLSPDDVFLLSGSTDKNAYIWRVDQPHRGPLMLKGHTDEVSDVAWCPTDYSTIVTLSDDCTMCKWHLDDEGPPAQEGAAGLQVVGTAEWSKKDIGVAAGPSCRSTSSPLTTRCLRSPLGSAGGTPQRPGLRVAGTTPKRTGASPNITGVSRLKGSPGVSPGGTRKIGPESPFKLQSPQKAKQIHVLLSPRKTPIPGCFDALSPRKMSVSGSKTQAPGAYLSQGRSVKRKLCDESDEGGSQGKRQRSDAPFTMNGVTPLGTPSRLLTCTENLTPVKAVTKHLVFSDTPEKVMQSPTMNLPNYVLNPEPRTPQSAVKHDSQKENGPKNWLVEMKHKKEASKETGTEVETDTVDPRVTPSRAQNVSTKKTKRATPRTSKAKTPTATRRSIMSYFSPKAETKKNSET